MTARSGAAVVLAVSGYFLVHLAVSVFGAAETPTGLVATAAVIVCGLLLIVTQVVSRKSER